MNPFRVIRRTATAVGVVLLVGGVVFLAILGVSAVIREDVHSLWKVPLAVIVFFAVAFALNALGSFIARRGRKAEREWNSKHE